MVLRPRVGSAARQEVPKQLLGEHLIEVFFAVWVLHVSPPDTTENLNVSQAAPLALEWTRVPKVQGNLLA
jgi:hypothetical protein